MKPKRKSITSDEKLTVVARAKRGESLNSLEKETGHQRTQIRKWIAQEDKLIELQRKQKRVKGGGRKPLFPEIEMLAIEWFKKQREKKLVVNYNMFRREAMKICQNIGTPTTIDNFLCSNKWIRGVCRRNKISSRKITHQSQQDNSSQKEICSKVKTFIAAINQKTANISKKFIFNMDETACYFDMCHSRTLHFQGDKTVDGLDTGHSKNRFTVVLCISAAGTVIRTQIILKGLKKIPKVVLPKNIDLVVSDGGSMTTKLMLTWISSCYMTQCNIFKCENSLLIMDSYGCHMKDEIIEKLKKFGNTDVLIIPPKTTSFLQPLDVSINHPFKNALREEWNSWLGEGPEDYTSKGYRKKPSYQNLVDFTAAALKKISPEIIIRSFECCGIGEYGERIALSMLNKKLQAALVTEKTSQVIQHNAELVLEDEEKNIDEEYELVFQEDLSCTKTDELLSLSSNMENNSKCESDYESD